MPIKNPTRALPWKLDMLRRSFRVLETQKKMIVGDIMFVLNEGGTWEQVAEVFGVTRQAAHQKYAALVKAERKEAGL